MSLNGPLVYLTNGTSRSLTCIPAVAAFAQLLKWPTNVLLRLPARLQADLVEKWVAEVRAAMPMADELPLISARPQELRPTLAEVAQSSGGIVALLPGRRRGLSRILSTNNFERLLHDGPLPVLALPRDGTLTTTIGRILFPADFSPRSRVPFAQAIALCQQLGAELHILHVYGPDRLLESEIDMERRSAATSPGELLALDKEQLANLRDEAAGQGVRVVATVSEGRAHNEIVRYAANQAIDLIVMPSHGPRSYEDILFGTTTTRVVLASDLPVLAIHA